MTNETVEILPCPFCGNQPITRNHYAAMLDCRSYVVACNNEKCFVKPHATSQGPDSYGDIKDQPSNEQAEKEVVNRWNTRKSDAMISVNAELLVALESVVNESVVVCDNGKYATVQISSGVLEETEAAIKKARGEA